MPWGDRSGDAWEIYYRAMCDYKQEHGNLDIPARYRTENGIVLGPFLANLRQARAKGSRSSFLTPERIAQLNTLGMVWETRDYRWEQKFRLVKQYYDTHGHVRMSADYVVEGVWLYRWLSEQKARLNGKPTGRNKTVKYLTQEQIAMLDSVGIRRNVDS